MERCLGEMRKLDSERLVPGWNYLRFFAVKEGLALLYETFGLDDEALMQYDELEAVLGAQSDALRLVPFGGQEPGDSSGAIFSAYEIKYLLIIFVSKLFIAPFFIFYLQFFMPFIYFLVFIFHLCSVALSSFFSPSRRKDYRGRLLDGSLTVFDLSHYLFARQAKLLFARDMALVVAERGLRLIDTLGRLLEAKNVHFHSYSYYPFILFL